MKEPEVIAIDNIGYKQTLVENNTESKYDKLNVSYYSYSYINDVLIQLYILVLSYV